MATENNKVGKEERAKELNLSSTASLPAPHVVEPFFKGEFSQGECLCCVFEDVCTCVCMTRWWGAINMTCPWGAGRHHGDKGMFDTTVLLGQGQS